MKTSYTFRALPHNSEGLISHAKKSGLSYSDLINRALTRYFEGMEKEGY